MRYKTGPRNAPYIAAASPDVIRGLLNSQRDWQEAAQEYERMLGIMVERNDRLRAALTALVEAADKHAKIGTYPDATEWDKAIEVADELIAAGEVESG
jgi:hypothetical protein